MPPDRLDDVWQAWRHTDRRFPPLWYGGGSKSLRQESGRWHQEGRGVAQYLALSANGAWAERCRYAGIRDDVRRETKKRKLWNLQVIEHDIADLSSFDRYLKCGLKPEWAIGLHAEVWPLAHDLRAARVPRRVVARFGLRRPGGAEPHTVRRRIEDEHYGAMPDPATNPRPDTYLHAVLITDFGAPTEYAMHHTCYDGSYHITFDRWSAATGYVP